MTQVTEEHLQAVLDERLAGLRAEVFEMFGGQQASEEGRREQAGAALKREFFAHVTAMEDKFKSDVDEGRRQLVAIKRELAEAKALLSSFPHAPEASAHATLHLTRRKGFDGLSTYGGGVQWKDWRFSTVRWLSQEHKPFEELLQKIERLKKEPEEPADGTPLKLGEEVMSVEQHWCCEELYALLSQKTKDGPKIIVRNLETLPVSRGARAWYRLVREAEGQIEARATELTEKLHDPNRKPVEAANLAAAVEQLESELREFQAITGKEPDEHAMVLALKRMLPKAIRDMLQTIEKDGYKEGKEYALKQARALRNERAEGPTKAGTPPLNELDHLTVPEGLSPEEQEAFVFAKKGKGKGFKGECYNCGKSGHRAADCFAPGGGKEGGGKKGQKGGYG